MTISTDISNEVFLEEQSAEFYAKSAGMKRPEHSAKMIQINRAKQLKQVMDFCIDKTLHNQLSEHFCEGAKVSESEANEQLSYLAQLYILKNQPPKDIPETDQTYFFINNLVNVIPQLDLWITGSLTSYMNAYDNVNLDDKNWNVDDYRKTCLQQLPELLRMRALAFKLILNADE